MALSDTELKKREATIATTQDKHKKTSLMLDLAFDILYQNKVQDALALLTEVEQLATQIGFKDALGRTNLGKAAVAYFSTQYDQADLYANKAIEIFQETNNGELLAETYTNLGMSYWSQGAYSKALNNIFKGIHLYQESGKSGRLAYALYLLGSFYLDLSDPDNAEKNFLESQKVLEYDNPYSVSKARSWIGLANVAIQREQYPIAIERLNTALKLQEESKDLYGMSRTFNDFGKVYRKLNDIDQAYLFYGKSLDIRLNATDKQALVTTYLDLGEFNFEQGQYELSINYLQNGLMWGKKLRAKAKIYRAHLLLSQIYEVLKEYDKAYQHLKQYNEVRDDVVGKDANLRIRNLESNFAKERSEKEAEIYRLRNVELKNLYVEIEHKNKAITDSIEYAKRIQNAMLPLHSDFLTYQEKAFIFYQPRDIVSGDFYWFATIPHPQDAALEMIFIAAVDCTGHGVPGAFMSLICNTLFDKIVRVWNITAPDEILKKAQSEIRVLLRQNELGYANGMDVCVVAMEETSEQQIKLAFAGAKRPLYYIKNGETTLQEIRGTRMSIGGRERKDKPTFTQTEFLLDKGSVLYLGSDGYADQNNLRRKSYTAKGLKALLEQIVTKPMAEQKQILDNTIDAHMEGTEQRDDIMLIGVKLS